MTLGRYEVVKHLAQGGMAEVFLARASGIEGFERFVVVKRIRAEQARDAQHVRMFLDEARLAASLHHQHIVQVHDVGEVDGEYFFVMEYVHGEDVLKLLTRASALRQRIPLEHVITIITAAAAGLHHAHEQRAANRTPLEIVHRDVSPANLLLGYDGGVKVTDFGVAKASRRTTKTESGTLKGKVAYMSPEQCNGQDVDRRSDVFALGIVLYELATVRRLFKGENDFLTMSQIVRGEVPPPSRAWPEIPPALEAIILKALAYRPGDRFATADEMRQALERFAIDHGLRMSSTALADYMKTLFPPRPEPWLVEDEEPEIELSFDFDGSATGLGKVTTGAFHRAAGSDMPSDAPIVRARRRLQGLRHRGLALGAAALAVGAIAVALLAARRGGTPTPAPPSAATAPAPVAASQAPTAAPTAPAAATQAPVAATAAPTPTRAAAVEAVTPAAAGAVIPAVAPPDTAPAAAPSDAAPAAAPPAPDVTVAPPAISKPHHKAAKRPGHVGPRRHWDPHALFPN